MKMNEQTRDAAIEQAWKRSSTYYRIYDGINIEDNPYQAERDWKAGFDAGAASVPRKEIVEKFEAVKYSIFRHIDVHDSCRDDGCPTHQLLEKALDSMDAILAELGVKK
jgi:hypothetical protein